MTKRRGAGESSPRTRADGRKEIRVSLGYDETGRRIRRSVYGKTMTEARQKADDLKARHRAGEAPTHRGRQQTVGQFLTTWLAAYEHTVRPSTYVRAKLIVNKHLVPALGRHPLDRLTPQHVQAMLDSKRDGLSPRSIQYLRVVLGTALRQAERWGMVARNAASLTTPPKVERTEIEPLSSEAAAKVLEAVAGDRLEPLISVALAVGLRQGEALALRWIDVNLDKGRVSVQHTLQRIDHEYVLTPPKTAQSRRTIALPAFAVDALRAHRDRQAFERTRAGERWGDTFGLVFTSERGRPLHGPTVTKRFQKLLTKAGLESMRFHDLRHSCASLLLAQGVPLSTIADVLGHSSIAVTSDVYGHLGDELRETAATAMDAALTAEN